MQVSNNRREKVNGLLNQRFAKPIQYVYLGNVVVRAIHKFIICKGK